MDYIVSDLLSKYFKQTKLHFLCHIAKLRHPKVAVADSSIKCKLKGID